MSSPALHFLSPLLTLITPPAGVVGAPSATKGQVPFALVVAASSSNGTPDQASQMLTSINQSIRKEIGGIAQLDAIVIAAKLPKTRSGKTLRRSIRAMVENAARHGTPAAADGDVPVPVPPTIEDPEVIKVIQNEIESYFAKRREGGGQGKAKL